MFTRPESTQTRSICDHRQANRNKGVDIPASQLPRQRASVGSTEAAKDLVARFGRIHRSIGEPPCARRCRRTEARNAAIGSMVPGPIRRGMLGAGRHASGGHATIINLGAGQSSDV